MPNVLRIFKKDPDPPTPPDQVRVIRSEITHTSPDVTPFSVTGVYEPTDPLPDSITVSLSHE